MPRFKTTEEFIAEAKAVHGGKYDYNKVEYTRSSDQVVIICKQHGEFPQKANHHLRGAGCPDCFGTKLKTTEEFIIDAKAVHGEKYDYSKVLYITAGDKVNIICCNHGEFPQSPNHHLAGSGCSKCTKTGFNPAKDSVLYLYNFGEFTGFGITNNFDNRHEAHSRNFKKKNIDATLIAKYDMSGESAQSLEKHLKQTLNIVDSGVKGFRTEAIYASDLPVLLDIIRQYDFAYI